MKDDNIRPYTDAEIEAQKRVSVAEWSKLQEMKKRNEVYAEHHVEAFKKPTSAWMRYPQKFWRAGATATALWALTWIGE